jgi:hypothetical protein
MTLADRVALLEATVAEWETRRRKLIPVELEKNENVQAVMRDCLQNYAAKMKDFAQQRILDAATTEQNRLLEEASYRLEQKQKEEMAELVAAINFYEKHGFSPPGYEFSEEIQER